MDEENPDAGVKSKDTTIDSSQVRIVGEDFERLSSHLCRGDGEEYAAYLTAGTNRYTRNGVSVLEYLVSDVHLIGDEEYVEQKATSVSLSAQTLHGMAIAADPDHTYADEQAILIAHSHPGTGTARYSGIDDDTEPGMFAPLTVDAVGPHGSLLFTENDIAGRVWPNNPTTIQEKGPAVTEPIDEIVVVDEASLRRIQTSNSSLDSRSDDVMDQMRARQALITGSEGNARLRKSHVAIVGAGGIGSLLVEDLAHEGIGELTIVDPDVVEKSNRSRIVGSTEDDAGPESATPQGDQVVPAAWSEAIPAAGRSKAEVAADFANRIDNSIRIHGIHAPIEAKRAVNAVVQADVIVTATDNATTRDLLSEIGQRYLRPVFDAGTGINANDGRVVGIETTFALTGPPWNCRDCQGLVDREEIRVENTDPDDLEYGLDLQEDEQPSVLAVNRYPATRAGFALYAYLSGLFENQYRIHWDTGSTQLLTADQGPLPNSDSESQCARCRGGSSGLRGTGDRAVFGPVEEMTSRSPPDAPTGALTELGYKAFYPKTPREIISALWRMIRSQR
jgi:tRNA A37 threonylcarbamoyladenosine dehydratase